ncbi:LuxR C-terminal-related transcriptional regulator [Curtobacterium oceanosedimentum]|uniref:LuxR C-terminal-related transcriptional regulator n=1 Tax=Curtobacterium oceanosedimentum TaxID=465820 RepID=UPI001CE1287E|nr:LuxR C-terminal-related transcriptional regulator [Curtobacterium oceanosedimentum]MCA5923714.1 LuxR C-terminal-related transcriptional regulator [Curtobacterium oceanosedimentum]
MRDRTTSRRGRLSDSPARTAWPVAQRAEEDRAVAVLAEHRWSVAIVGAPGLGKSTVAARVTDRVAARDGTGRTVVVPITAVAASRSMPFEVIAERFGELPASISELSDDSTAEERLAAIADLADRDVLLRVDDADHLDAVSARYVAWLVRRQGARLVLTCRDFTALKEPLRALWQDDLLERIDLQPLTLHETTSLVTEALGSPLEIASAERVHRATAGNPLYLREVVRAARTSGALDHTATGWYWRGRVTASDSLSDMYRTELGALPEDLRDVVDIVALADPIPLGRLLGLVSGGDVDRVVALGLVRIDALEDGAAVVRPSHPLVGEVIRTLVPVARRTALFARANAFRADRPEGAPPAARLRAVLWSLECGVLPSVDQLVDAAQVAVRLQEYESGIALASAALRTTLTPTEQVTAHCLRSLAHSYSDGREAGRADAEAAWAVAKQHRGAVSDDAVIEACETLANIRQFHDDDVAAAVALTEAASRLVSDEAVERLRLLRMAHLGWGGDFAEVRAEVERTGIEHAPTVPVSFLVVAPCAVMALATAGRLEAAAALARRAVATAIAHVEDAPWSVGENTSVLHQVQVWRGDLDDLVIEVPAGRSSPYLKYDFTLELIGQGNLAIGQRRWDDAIAAFSAACERYDVADHGGFAAYPWARLAMAHAFAGNAEEAAAALDRARTTPERAMRITGEQVAVTIAWTESLLGNPAGLQHADEIIARSTANGSWTHVMYGQALHYSVAMQNGRDTAAALDRLRDAAARVDGPLATAIGEYADAQLAGDQTRVLAAQRVLASHGMSVAAGQVKPALTKREYEVAELAAQGLSNRRIAEVLGLSTRTIDAHLSRVFTKWDLHARSELSGLI